MNTGGPAFPVQSVYIEDQETNSRGMTLRDYFAAQALQGLISATSRMTFADGQYIVDVMDEVRMTKFAYSHADAMLKAREE